MGKSFFAVLSCNTGTLLLSVARRWEALRYAAEAEQGTWAAYQLPLLLLGAGALLLSLTQRAIFTQAQNFVLGLTTLVPALLALTRPLLASKPAGPAAAGA